MYTHAHTCTYAHMCAHTQIHTKVHHAPLRHQDFLHLLVFYSHLCLFSLPPRLTSVVADIILFACPQPLAQCGCTLESAEPFCGIRTRCSPSPSEHTLTELCPASPKGSELSWCGLPGSAHTRRTRETHVRGRRATQDGTGPDSGSPSSAPFPSIHCRQLKSGLCLNKLYSFVRPHHSGWFVTICLFSTYKALNWLPITHRHGRISNYK